jgi:hypothetical protein
MFNAYQQQQTKDHTRTISLVGRPQLGNEENMCANVAAVATCPSRVTRSIVPTGE